jgi:hypothetical protein
LTILKNKDLYHIINDNIHIKDIMLNTEKISYNNYDIEMVYQMLDKPNNDQFNFIGSLFTNMNEIIFGKIILCKTEYYNNKYTILPMTKNDVMKIISDYYIIWLYEYNKKDNKYIYKK